MDRQKIVKGFSLVLGIVGIGSILLTSASTVWELAQPKAVSQSVPISKDAQLAAQENGYWSVLRDEPNNRTAIKGLEAIAQDYAADRKWSKSIALVEKLRTSTSKSPNSKFYDRYLAELKKKASAEPSPSPSAKP